MLTWDTIRRNEVPYSNESWESPESNLDANDYCAVCLVDLNERGAEKIKSRCYLPVRKTPGGPYNKAALRNAAARLPQSDIPGDEKRKAARKLVALMREGDMGVGPATLRMAGMR